MKVLIADDDVTTLRVLERHLRKWGYEVITAGDGNDAWSRLQDPGAPRLVILDWMMPGLDGIEICRRVRQLEHGNLTHIIILTARETPEDVVVGFAAGADDFIKKRFDKDELRARVKVGERIVELQQALASRIRELEEAMSHLKRLQGILPICMHCHRIRDDREVWQRLEEYITEKSDAMLSHSLCPACLKQYYPEYAPDEPDGETVK
jgi:sigma-B regulation protein RsbU (phosphoserine phosphatase)